MHRVLQSIIFFTVPFCCKWNRVSRSRFTVNWIALMALPYTYILTYIVPLGSSCTPSRLRFRNRFMRRVLQSISVICHPHLIWYLMKLKMICQPHLTNMVSYETRTHIDLDLLIWNEKLGLSMFSPRLSHSNSPDDSPDQHSLWPTGQLARQSAQARDGGSAAKERPVAPLPGAVCAEKNSSTPIASDTTSDSSKGAAN
jgi:hypothetical protein